MSHKEMHCLRSYFVCQFPDSGYFSTTWLLKQVKQISANKGNFYWPSWIETSWSGKQRLYMTGKRWGKKAKPWVEIVTYLTPGNLIVSSATSVSFKDAGGGWNSSRKRTMTYIVVKSEVKKSVQHLKTFSWYQPGSLGMTGIILFVSQ